MALVLVVDDDADSCEMLSKRLEIQGYETMCAHNGWEALLALDRRTVDLILLDVMMPGMDGMTFIKILRGAKETMRTPVVLVTALDPPDVMGRLGNLAVEGILCKGDRLFDQLIQTVHRTLGRGDMENNYGSAQDPGSRN